MPTSKRWPGPRLSPGLTVQITCNHFPDVENFFLMIVTNTVSIARLDRALWHHFWSWNQLRESVKISYRTCHSENEDFPSHHFTSLSKWNSFPEISFSNDKVKMINPLQSKITQENTVSVSNTWKAKSGQRQPSVWSSKLVYFASKLSKIHQKKQKNTQ